MPIQTSLSNPPYGDTVPVTSDYYRVLTKPGVSLQSRELIELQTIFANQIERFGDNVLKPGTIVSGCNFSFLNPFPYVKLLDQDPFGNPITPSAYANLTVINGTTGLRANIIDTLEGFVSSDPNLKTLYLKYMNGGFSGNTKTFSSGDTLTVYDSIRNGVEQVNIISPGQGFSNTSTLFGVSALAVTVTGGTLSNGQYITNGLGANVQIIKIDSTTLANSGQLILSITPRPVDLANAAVNASAWSFSNGQSFTNSGNTATGTVSGVIGFGYQGLPVTDSLGTIQQVLTLNKGFGYTTPPTVTLQSANNSSGYGSLNLVAQNYVAEVIVASTANSVGNGYAFGISSGIAYVGGTFLRVPAQSIIVSNYNQLPDNVSVVFSTIETIITSDQDPTLNDPAAGPNNGAPGADRLNIEPVLQVMGTANASSNSQTLPLVSWNQGNPYVQNQPTQYSSVGDAIAQAAYDLGGNFYIDPFLVTTSTVTSNLTVVRFGGTFDIVVDPGSAYINGHKIQTDSNFIMNAPYEYATAVSNYSVSLNYGNYLVVNNLGGTFQFNTGDTVTLYSQAKGYLSNSALVRAGNTTPQGTALGTAHVRGMQHLSGVPGTNSAQYALYLFDVNMNPGNAFANVLSVYYGGNNHGIADVIQTFNSTANQNATVLVSPNLGGLVYPTGHSSLNNVNTATYQFSSLDQTVTVANSGILTKSLSTTGWSFPWFGTNLSASQLDQLILVPTAVDLVSSTNAAGSWVANVSTANLVANAGTAGLTNFVAGDWVYLLGNTTQVDMRQIQQVVNNTFLILDSATTVANTSAVLARAYPKNLPIPLSTRSGCSANVSANGTLLSINLGFPIAQATSEAMSLAAPIQISNATPTAKTINRNGYVTMVCSNNAGNTVGPWCLGVPDAIRLKGVYIGNSTVSNTGTNYVSAFSIDNNQNIDYLGLSYLYLTQGANVPISGSSYILVQFDYASTAGGGFYATPSYTQTSNVTQRVLLNDASAVSFQNTAACTWEVPELFTDNGVEIDLLGCVDFRPAALATATPAANAASSPLNPSNTTTFNTVEKLFPLPGSAFTANIEYFVPRIDSVYVDQTGSINWIMGQPMIASGRSPAIPAGTMKIADILVPEYPDIPANKSMTMTGLINTGIANKKFQSSRINNHSITLLSTIQQDAAKVYTNRDIANLDTRITNLEYYVNLNQLETATQTMVIPSSSDPAVNRYQYGFFADDFSTADLMDTSYPTYRASQQNGDIVPSMLTWEVFIGSDYSGAQAYVNQKVLSQQNATLGDHTDPTAKPQCAVSLANTIAFQLVYRNAYDFNGLPPQDGQVDTVNLTLADATHMSGATSSGGASGLDSSSANNLGSGVVTLFFYAYDNPVEFQILQGNTVVADSSSAVNLTANDITNLTTGTVMNQWFNDQTSLYNKNFVVANGAFVEFAGKVAWNYSGSGSTALQIRTTNGVGTRNWRWVLSYPINGDTAGCTPPPPNHSCPSGYTYSASAGGCILNTPTPTPQPPVVNIVWTECLNWGPYGIVQQILAIQAEGAQVGTITAVHGNLDVTGTLAQWLDPTSWQNQVALANYGGNSNQTAAASVATFYEASTTGSFGHYNFVFNGNQDSDYITYTAPSGAVSVLPGSSGTAWAFDPELSLLNNNYQDFQPYAGG